MERGGDLEKKGCESVSLDAISVRGEIVWKSGNQTGFNNLLHALRDWPAGRRAEDNPMMARMQLLIPPRTRLKYA